jgi:hypothetical protein
MPALSAADILHVWEVGRGQSLVDRALTVLERAWPERGREALTRLPLGTRDRLLLEVRAAALGQVLEATACCPQCGEVVEFRLGAEALLEGAEAAGDGRPERGAERTLAAGGYTLRYRLLDSTDLLAAATLADAASARVALVERCVLEARREGRGGERIAAADLPEEVVGALAERLVAGDPQIETLIDLTCPACQGQWRSELDLASFVWEELRGQALHLLDDVDTLARAYGWSEGEILSLGAERRRAYVERVL